MDFLFSSNILIDFPIKKALRVFSDQKVTGVEIWVEHLWKGKGDLRSIRKTLDNLGLKRTLHSPSRDINITSSNPGIRRESLQQTIEALEIAAQLEANVVTVHPGHMSSSKDRPEDYFEANLESFHKIARKGRDLGLKIAVEVMEMKPMEIVTEPENLNSLLEYIDFDCIGTTFDIAHAASCFKNLVDGEALNGMIINYMRKLRKIYNVHISNATSAKVHTPLLRGEYDFFPVLEELVKIYEGTVTIEGFAPGEGMQVLREDKVVTSKWKEMLSDVEQKTSDSSRSDS
ncbi:MAG: sugar phosphate isomerase/epimerase [Kosmotogaceae bacterium]|nr:sugar phosphate isomerase/epimerase [Kosmotogaceae bacterium]